MLVRTETRKRTLRSNFRLSYARRVLLLALLVGLPGVAGSLVVIWAFNGLDAETAWQLTAVIVGAWLLLAFWLRRQIVFPLQTISNLVAALREGDYSVRGRSDESVPPADTLE
jgi:hypothetical protein